MREIGQKLCPPPKHTTAKAKAKSHPQARTPNANSQTPTSQRRLHPNLQMTTPNTSSKVTPKTERERHTGQIAREHTASRTSSRAPSQISSRFDSVASDRNFVPERFPTPAEKLIDQQNQKIDERIVNLDPSSKNSNNIMVNLAASVHKSVDERIKMLKIDEKQNKTVDEIENLNFKFEEFEQQVEKSFENSEKEKKEIVEFANQQKEEQLQLQSQLWKLCEMFTETKNEQNLKIQSLQKNLEKMFEQNVELKEKVAFLENEKSEGNSDSKNNQLSNGISNDASSDEITKRVQVLETKSSQFERQIAKNDENNELFACELKREMERGEQMLSVVSSALDDVAKSKQEATNSREEIKSKLEVVQSECMQLISSTNEQVSKLEHYVETHSNAIHELNENKSFDSNKKENFKTSEETTKKITRVENITRDITCRLDQLTSQFEFQKDSWNSDKNNRLDLQEKITKISRESSDIFSHFSSLKHEVSNLRDQHFMNSNAQNKLNNNLSNAFETKHERDVKQFYKELQQISELVHLLKIELRQNTDQTESNKIDLEDLCKSLSEISKNVEDQKSSKSSSNVDPLKVTDLLGEIQEKQMRQDDLIRDRNDELDRLRVRSLETREKVKTLEAVCDQLQAVPSSTNTNSIIDTIVKKDFIDSEHEDILKMKNEILRFEENLQKQEQQAEEQISNLSKKLDEKFETVLRSATPVGSPTKSIEKSPGKIKEEISVEEFYALQRRTMDVEKKMEEFSNENKNTQQENVSQQLQDVLNTQIKFEKAVETYEQFEEKMRHLEKESIVTKSVVESVQKIVNENKNALSEFRKKDFVIENDLLTLLDDVHEKFKSIENENKKRDENFEKVTNNFVTSSELMNFQDNFDKSTTNACSVEKCTNIVQDLLCEVKEEIQESVFAKNTELISKALEDQTQFTLSEFEHFRKEQKENQKQVQKSFEMQEEENCHLNKLLEKVKVRIDQQVEMSGSSFEEVQKNFERIDNILQEKKELGVVSSEDLRASITSLEKQNVEKEDNLKSFKNDFESFEKKIELKQSNVIREIENKLMRLQEDSKSEVEKMNKRDLVALEEKISSVQNLVDANGGVVSNEDLKNCEKRFQEQISELERRRTNDLELQDSSRKTTENSLNSDISALRTSLQEINSTFSERHSVLKNDLNKNVNDFRSEFNLSFENDKRERAQKFVECNENVTRKLSEYEKMHNCSLSALETEIKSDVSQLSTKLQEVKKDFTTKQTELSDRVQEMKGEFSEKTSALKTEQHELKLSASAQQASYKEIESSITQLREQLPDIESRIQNKIEASNSQQQQRLSEQVTHFSKNLEEACSKNLNVAKDLVEKQNEVNQNRIISCEERLLNSQKEMFDDIVQSQIQMKQSLQKEVSNGCLKLGELCDEKYGVELKKLSKDQKDSERTNVENFEKMEAKITALSDEQISNFSQANNSIEKVSNNLKNKIEEVDQKYEVQNVDFKKILDSLTSQETSTQSTLTITQSEVKILNEKFINFEEKSDKNDLNLRNFIGKVGEEVSEMRKNAIANLEQTCEKQRGELLECVNMCDVTQNTLDKRINLVESSILTKLEKIRELLSKERLLELIRPELVGEVEEVSKEILSEYIFSKCQKKQPA